MEFLDAEIQAAHSEQILPCGKPMRQRFAASGTAHPTGTFEILAITAGIGNGWNFPAATLQDSIPLWNGVECFLDHDFMISGGRSVRDLAGMLFAPAWDDARAGIVATLKAVGPAGQVLTELGREMFELRVPEPASGSPKGEGASDQPALPKIGFSADVSFTASKTKEVQKILKVFSVDLVIDPARGGQFIRSLNQQLNLSTEVIPMEEKPTQAADHTAAPTTPLQTQLQADSAAVRQLLGEQQRIEALEAEAAQARIVRIQMCGYLLDSALAASHLPQPAADRVRAQYQNVIFEAPTLQATIEDYRKMVSDLTSSAVVHGPGRITAMYDTRDKLQAATDDLLGAPRDAKMKDVQVNRLQGIRELYLMLTGDDDLHGGYYPERARLATTSDFTGLVKNALNKLVINQWELLGRAGYDWWTHIATV